jgi:ABC-type polysaccharide/polyol phosphate export permease
MLVIRHGAIRNYNFDVWHLCVLFVTINGTTQCQLIFVLADFKALVEYETIILMCGIPVCFS